LGCVPAAFALGLGGMSVDSALGEPLDARITLLSVTPSERRSLQARLGNAQTYADYGVKRPAIIDSINVVVRGSSPPTDGTVVHAVPDGAGCRPARQGAGGTQIRRADQSCGHAGAGSRGAGNWP